MTLQGDTEKELILDPLTLPTLDTQNQVVLNRLVLQKLKRHIIYVMVQGYVREYISEKHYPESCNVHDAFKQGV